MVNKMEKPESTQHTQFDPHDQDTKEIEYKVKTDHDDYSDDTSADPEGASERNAQPTYEYPNWVFNDFELRRTNYYKRPFEDGQKHLVPLDRAVDDALAYHTDGMDNWHEVVKRAVGIDVGSGKRSGGDANVVDTFLVLHNSYSNIIENVGPRESFHIISSLGDITTALLARRAFSKRSFFDMSGRVNPDDQSSDALERAQDRLAEDSYRAACFWQLHNDMWHLAGWRNEPKYSTARIRSAIVREFDGLARNYIEPNFRQSSGVKRANSGDYAKVMQNF